MNYVVGYGLFLDPERMSMRRLNCTPLAFVRLDGLELEFCRYANVKPANSSIYGTLYEVSDEDLVQMDRIEGYPEFYIRQQWPISNVLSMFDGKELEDLPRMAYVYSMNEKFAVLQDPSTDYYENMLSYLKKVLGEHHRYIQHVVKATNFENVG